MSPAEPPRLLFEQKVTEETKKISQPERRSVSAVIPLLDYLWRPWRPQCLVSGAKVEIGGKLGDFRFLLFIRFVIFGTKGNEGNGE
jgi:hypothetical protein